MGKMHEEEHSGRSERCVCSTFSQSKPEWLTPFFSAQRVATRDQSFFLRLCRFTKSTQVLIVVLWSMKTRYTMPIHNQTIQYTLILLPVDVQRLTFNISLQPFDIRLPRCC